MPIREHPYSNYNFLVDIGSGDTAAVAAGFTEVDLPEAVVEVIEYRQGNDKTSASRKLPGRVRYGNLTLKRGVMGSADLYQWWAQVRDGDPGYARDVRVSVQDEARQSVVLTLRLYRAWPVRYQISDLRAEASEALVETLELTFDRLEVEFDG